jgi:hypothetical protein
MKKTWKIITLIFISGVILILPNFTNAAAYTLNNVRLSIEPRVKAALASWTISFEMPKTGKIGFIEISLGGELPSLANSTLIISGLSGGRGVVGKTNPNCVSNCDDIKYLFDTPTNVAAGTKIVFTVNSVRNADSTAKTGLSFINVFSSAYPKRELFAYASNIFLPLEAVAQDAELIPPSATTEGAIEGGISGILLNDLFYQHGAKTTKISTIADLTRVQDFTLDLLGKEKVTFKGSIDLSKNEAAALIANLSSHMKFGHLDFSVDKSLFDYFKVPLEVTYYDVPFVYNPDIIKDGKILSRDKVGNYKFFIIDNQTEVSFIINEAGDYKLAPHFEVYINDNQLVESENGQATFSGRISDSGAKITIVLNNQEVKDAITSIDPSTGSFSFTVQLIPGANLIEASALSAFGNLDKITKTVQYQSGLKPVVEKREISPFNIAAVILALVAIILILWIHHLSKQKRRRRY